MTDTPLPAPLSTFIDATNAGDSDGFVAAFADDAVLVDWGRAFHGREGAAEWNRTDNIGRGGHFEIMSWEPGPSPDTTIVTVSVTGDGFNGTGPIEFGVRDGLISRMIIRP